MEASVDGMAFVDSNASATAISGLISVTGSINDATLSIQFDQDAEVNRTYQVGEMQTQNVSYSINDSSFTGATQFTLTSRGTVNSEIRYQGTFSGTLTSSQGNGQTKTVSEGQFAAEVSQ